MNVTYRVWTALSVCAALSARPSLAQVPDSLQLTSDAAGRIRVGMSVAEVQRILGRDRIQLFDRNREGHFDPALAMAIPGAAVSPAIVAPVREWPCPAEYSIQGLLILDPRFRTPQGVGVGSTLGKLREHYAIRLSQEEGPHAWVEAIRTNFQLENGSGRDDVRVTGIWLPGPSPDVIRRDRCPTSRR